MLNRTKTKKTLNRYNNADGNDNPYSKNDSIMNDRLSNMHGRFKTEIQNETVNSIPFQSERATKGETQVHSVGCTRRCWFEHESVSAAHTELFLSKLKENNANTAAADIKE